MIRPRDGSSHASDLMALTIGALGALCIWLATTITTQTPITSTSQWSIPQQGLLRWFDGQSWINESDRADTQTQSVVLLIHGLDEPGGIWDDAAPALHQAGYQAIRFDYPNDQAIHTSAIDLHEAFARLKNQSINELSIVAHSMGGLIARDTLTHPDMGNSTGQIASVTVRKLILAGTPNEGSPWAKLRAVGDLRERVYRWIASGDLDPTIFTTLSDDGDGQAGIDLLPESEFLAALNSRPMPHSVSTTCIVARIVDPLTTTSNPKLDEAANTLGDGVVSVESATLDSCTDIVRLTANHRSMLRTIELEEGWRTMIGSDQAPDPQAIAIILDRLSSD